MVRYQGKSHYFFQFSFIEHFYVDIPCGIWNNLYSERAMVHSIDDEIYIESTIGPKNYRDYIGNFQLGKVKNRPLYEPRTSTHIH